MAVDLVACVPVNVDGPPDPTFLVWAEDRQTPRYWTVACGAGILFGFAACVMTGFYLPVSIALAAGAEGTALDWALLLTVAPFLFAISAGIVISFKYFWAVVCAGVAFGVVNGAAVRWRMGSTRRRASRATD